jgi:carbon-monoxide dehydrogenase medium subunit
MECPVEFSNLTYLQSLPRFLFFEPKSIEEAQTLLEKFGNEAKIMAGGTDLLVQMRQGKNVRNLINIKKIPDLNGIEYYESEGLKIGALTVLNKILQSDIIKEKFPVLVEAAEQSGPPNIKNLSTVGGNICNASPGADMVPSLLTLDARVKIMGIEGCRYLPLEDFFLGPCLTSLKKSDIVTHLLVPDLPPSTFGTYLKITARTSLDLASVGVAVTITLDPGVMVCKEVKIALGAVAPTPIRAHLAEENLKNNVLSNDRIEEASLIAQKESNPHLHEHYLHGSADWKKLMVGVLTKRALENVMHRSELDRG